MQFNEKLFGKSCLSTLIGSRIISVKSQCTVELLPPIPFRSSNLLLNWTFWLNCMFRSYKIYTLISFVAHQFGRVEVKVQILNIYCFFFRQAHLKNSKQILGTLNLTCPNRWAAKINRLRRIWFGWQNL